MLVGAHLHHAAVKDNIRFQHTCNLQQAKPGSVILHYPTSRKSRSHVGVILRMEKSIFVCLYSGYVSAYCRRRTNYQHSIRPRNYFVNLSSCYINYFMWQMQQGPFEQDGACFPLAPPELGSSFRPLARWAPF